MSDGQSFIDQAVSGRASLDDIDEFVERWHEGEGASNLHEFLGMTHEEYGLWLREPNALAAICAARRRGKPLLETISNDEHTRNTASPGSSGERAPKQVAAKR